MEGIRYNYVKEYSHNLEIPSSQPNPLKTKPNYYGTLPAKKTAGNFFSHEDEKIERPSREPVPQVPEKRMRATFNQPTKKDDLNTSSSNDRYILLKDAKRLEIRHTVATEPDIARTSKAFNLQNYMQQLKEYDKYTTGNQNYITLEKEGLLKNKLDIETGHLTRMMKLPGDNLSPRFKAGIFTTGGDGQM